MAKTQLLQIQRSPEDLDRIERVARAEHLDKSTWARRGLLKAVERWEEEQSEGER